MDKLDEPKKVRNVFRRAIMLCHPDKHQGGESDTVYIATRVFAALNDAFNEYKNEPGVNL